MAESNWFPLLLLLATVLLLGAGVGWLSRQAALAVAKRRNPDEPWTYKRGWRENRISGQRLSLLLTALFFGVVGLPLVALGLELVADAWRAPTLEHFLGLVLALMALLPMLGFYFACREALRLLKLGRWTVELRDPPGRIGGTISGTMSARFSSSPPSSLELQLICAGTHLAADSTSETSGLAEEQWESEGQSVSIADAANPRDVVLPFSFVVPEHLPESSVSLPSFYQPLRNFPQWRLVVTSDEWKKGVQESFIVPVFRVASVPTT